MPDENVTTTPEGTGTQPPATGTTPPAATTPPAVPDFIPADLSAHKSLGKFKTAHDLARAYVNAEGLLGKRIDDLLGPEGNPEMKAAFRAKMGVPEASNGYEDITPPEGYELDTTLIGAFKEQAHKTGLSKDQFNQLAKWYAENEIARFTARNAELKQEQEKAWADMRSKWGAAADRNVALAQRVVAEYGGEDVRAALDETGAGNNPAIIAWLARIGQTMAEDNLITATNTGDTADSAKARIAALTADPKSPYRDARHPGHKAAVEEVTKLYQLAYGTI